MMIGMQYDKGPRKKKCGKDTCQCLIETGEGVMETPYCSVECERGRPCPHSGCDCKDLNLSG